MLVAFTHWKHKWMWRCYRMKCAFCTCYSRQSLNIHNYFDYGSIEIYFIFTFVSPSFNIDNNFDYNSIVLKTRLD